MAKKQRTHFQVVFLNKKSLVEYEEDVEVKIRV